MSREVVTPQEAPIVAEARTELSAQGPIVINLIEYRQEHHPGPETAGPEVADTSPAPPLVTTQSAPPADIIAFPLNLDLSGVQELAAVITAPAPVSNQPAHVTAISGRSAAAKTNALERSLGTRAA